WRGDPWAPHTDQLWATAAAARLQQLNTQIGRQRLQAMLQLGNADTVLNDVEPLIVAEPLDEGLWELSMLAAYRLGRVGQALDTYTRARRVLIEEAGIEPGPQLRDLQAKILDRDVSLPGPGRAAAPVVGAEPEVHVPVRRTELIGRDNEMADLLTALSVEQLVTVVGPAGCGKTRLVIDVARRAAPAFPDGVWFVDLTAANDAGQLLDAITSALGLAAPETGTVADAVKTFTRTRQMLLVLDNCEHLLDPVAALVESLLDERSEVGLLATSREPLDIDGERVLTLAPLELPARQGDLSGPALADAPAVQLFLQRLRVAAPQAATGLDAVDPDRVSAVRLAAQICEAVDGLPLAIELAAGQARTFTLEEILARVRTDSASLSRTGRGGARHHATLSGAIQLSVDTLSTDELNLHRALAVIPGPLTTDVAAHLTAHSTADTAAGLTNLVYRSMLSPVPPARLGGPSRFSQLVTIRSHSLTALSADAQHRLAQRRDEWVADLVADGPMFGQPGEVAWFERIDDNLAALRATLQHCLVDQPNAIGPFIAPRLELYWLYRGMLPEWERWTGIAVQSPVGDPFDRLVAGSCLAQASTMANRGELSRQWMDELEAYPHPLSTQQKAWLVHYMLAIMFSCYILGAVDDGRRAAALTRRLADESGDPSADLIAQVAHVLSISQTEAPAVVLPTIDAVYRQAQLTQNRYAIWSTAAAGMIAGAVGQVPEVGLRWSDVLLDIFDQFGAESPTTAIELRGLLLAAADQPYEAVRAIAHSRSLARRAGERWPLREETKQVLQAAQSRLTTADADRAYQQGLLGRDPIRQSHPAGAVADRVG
ncbi:MAG: BTAD domain-containing putative transcriptional regulator, partial [Propionibacteriaceae bacterium]